MNIPGSARKRRNSPLELLFFYIIIGQADYIRVPMAHAQAWFKTKNIQDDNVRPLLGYWALFEQNTNMKILINSPYFKQFIRVNNVTNKRISPIYL